ncbi:NAD(P)-binding protein [Obba rivulosa]|uniref:NAD(P)-binding protein n=1 Tax=Obba rivulosa TaxID=1052685 RepID=A0A8E2ALZ9_9APHY|nr:NAD(P)-binding protein [Obba rivulosa]
MSVPLPLAGKVALVTGSSRGIGAAVAQRLAADGATVIVNYVSNAAAAQTVVDAINSAGAGSAIALRADVSSTADSRALIDDIIRRFGSLDIIVLNAGLMNTKVLKELDENNYTDHFDVNVKAPLFTIQAAEPHLKSGSRIIFFSSTTAHMSGVSPNYIVYTATKGAVEQFTRILAKDLGARGITVNCVAPGPIDTELFRNGKTPELIATFANMHPQKRLGTPEDVAPVVAFLAREDSRWVNGQTILINGGLAV